VQAASGDAGAVVFLRLAGVAAAGYAAYQAGGEELARNAGRSDGAMIESKGPKLRECIDV
jgi:hypothetical protein